MNFPRPHARFRAHTFMRPSTRCRGCGALWPCAPARMSLLVAYRGDAPGLLLFLAERFLAALEDLPDQHPAGLGTRIFGWLPRHVLMPPDRC